MKLVLLTLLQSLLTVVGMGLVNLALDGKPLNIRDLTVALFTSQGLLGVVLLFGSFIVTSVILSFAKLQVFIPINTGMVFLLTLAWGALLHNEKVTFSMAVGMVLIAGGITLISTTTTR